MAGTSAVTTETQPGPVGIGGWLILPIIEFSVVMVFTIVYRVQNLLDDLKIFPNPQVASLRFPFGFVLLLEIFTIVSAILCLVLLFQKKPIIVQVATVYYVVTAAHSLTNLWYDARLHELFPDEPRDRWLVESTIASVITSIIGISYFHVSKRVRNTFVNKNTTPGLNPGSLDANP